MDAENRLAAMETEPEGTLGIPASESVKLKFAYDYFGRRIRNEIYQPASSTSAANTVRYVWDGWHCRAKLDGSNSEGYLWGPDVTNTIGGAGGVGGLVGVVELSPETGSGTRIHFPTFDAGGNVTSLVSEYPEVAIEQLKAVHARTRPAEAKAPRDKPAQDV